MKSCIVIPARYDSTRLPGKVLLDIGGKPMIQWVYERAKQVKNVDHVLIATDSELVYQSCTKFGAECFMTSSMHLSGTDRIGEAAVHLSDYDYIINMQADEPLINPVSIENLIDLISENAHIKIATLVTPVKDENDLFDFNVVKVVLNTIGKAMYFSRNVIPAQRDLPFKSWFVNHQYFRHIGVYGFNRETLLSLVQIESSSLESAEKLEQLKWLENGFDVFCLKSEDYQIGVDTQEDLERIRNLISL